MGHPRHLQRPALDPCAGCVPFIRLVGRRLLGTLPTLLGVLVVAFLLLNVAPGDPVAAMVGERADAATIARLRAELRLDDPLPARFGHYVWGIVRGDLGRSYITARPIAQDLKERFPKTAELALAAMTLAALAGITLGVLSAVRPGGAFDRIAMLLSYLGVSFPVYWVGLLLILVFAVAPRWLPPPGSGGLAYLALPAPLPISSPAAARAPGGRRRTTPLRGSVERRLAQLLDVPPFERATWGLYVVDDRARVLYQRNADRFAVPASNTKLVVTAAATVLLPPDYRVATSLYANGRVDAGVLHGEPG